MVSTALELLGLGLVVTFLGVVWAPLALLGAGLVLILWANAHPGRGRRGRLGAALVASVVAGRAAWARQEHRT